MGLEVGWYLRLGKTDKVEALVSRQGADQVRHQEHISTDWAFAFEDKDDHVLAVMTRKKPLFADTE